MRTNEKLGLVLLVLGTLLASLNWEVTAIVFAILGILTFFGY